MIDTGNLFERVPLAGSGEVVETMLETGALRLERIVSTGQATPPGEWYDQDRDEWVLLVRGAARLRFVDEETARVMTPGDWILIPAHRRHRVDWTDPAQPTVWLALHHRA
jgi:cupin 2 domain-containing protein